MLILLLTLFSGYQYAATAACFVALHESMHVWIYACMHVQSLWPKDKGIRQVEGRPGRVTWDEPWVDIGTEVPSPTSPPVYLI